MKKVIVLLILFYCFIFPFIANANEDIALLFTLKNCHGCEQMKDILKQIPSFKWKELEISNKENRKLLQDLCSAKGLPSQFVPALFINDIAVVRWKIYTPTESDIPFNLENFKTVLEKGNINYNVSEKDIAIWGIIVAAILDSFNPCDFSVMILLLGTLILAKKKIVLSGVSFVSGVFIAYLFLGIVLYYSISFLHPKDTFIHVIGSFFIIFGTCELLGMSVKIPIPAQKLIVRATKIVSNPLWAFIIGFLDAILLAPCTSGPYLAAITLMAQEQAGISLLFLYNAIFIIPLLFIVGLVKRFSRTAWIEQLKTSHTKLFQIFSGVACVLLGLIMFFI